MSPDEMIGRAQEAWEEFFAAWGEPTPDVREAIAGALERHRGHLGPWQALLDDAMADLKINLDWRNPRIVGFSVGYGLRIRHLVEAVVEAA